MAKFTADFETIAEPDGESCRVWAYSICEIGNPENFMYGNDIYDFMYWCYNTKFNPVCYFHNLKFDGNYIISWLFNAGFKYISDKKDKADWTFTCLISDVGQFYSIEVYFDVEHRKSKKSGKEYVKVNKVKFLDSLKILNMPVEEVAKAFDLPISKLKLDYNRYRPEGYELQQYEIDYIRNDVEIMARALGQLFSEGADKMTAASDALSYYKEKCCRNFEELYPVFDFELDSEIRQSYKGGFTYLSTKYTGKETGSGLVFDVNSAYPAMMRYKMLPFGMPEFFEGKYEKDEAYPLYVQRITCIFELKKDKIPSIQIRNSYGFMKNEYLVSSNNEIVSLTLTSVDLDLFLQQYDVWSLNYICGWKFQGKQGLFDSYVDYWMDKKIQAKKEHNAGMKQIAKLYLNSLYGKFGKNPIGTKKIPVFDDGYVEYISEEETHVNPIYVPMASFITAYQRKYIIESSQHIRDWSEKNLGFDAYVYSDTDSMHCLLTHDDVVKLQNEGFPIDDYKLGYWKEESHFKRGKYLHQKCYIEEKVDEESSEDEPINVVVAGLPRKLGAVINFDNFNKGFTTADLPPYIIEKYGKKLIPVTLKGGVILQEVDFTIK